MRYSIWCSPATRTSLSKPERLRRRTDEMSSSVLAGRLQRLTEAGIATIDQ
jgi:DNA-binding HxlR family transcriptional regulator